MSQPQTVILDPDRLSTIKKELDEANNTELKAAVAALVVQADQWLEHWLTDSPWTVTAKTICPPSGDYHDYISQAPYWWPSNSPSQLPYVRRDGEYNPEALKSDKANWKKVFSSSHVLILAWYYTGGENYAVHASAILRAWFVTSETRMNPHLSYAQSIPGISTGRSTGVIDFSQWYTNVVDAEAILANSHAWTANDHGRFLDWNRDFLDWLLDSDFGKEESKELNNHGSFAILQKAVISISVGRRDVFLQEVEAMKTLISRVIRANGAQPFELKRTRSWHYSCYNLVALTRMAEACKRVGVDLWDYRGIDGQSLHAAIEYLIPAATGAAIWQHPETMFLPYLASDLIRASASAGNTVAKNAVDKLQMPPFGDLWPLRQVPENLDAFG